jgi:MFS family permease
MSDARDPQQMTPAGRRAVLGGSFGFWVDYFDIYLPVLALTPALAYFQPKSLPPATVTTLGYIVLAVTLIGRPIGAIIFGHLGDVIGRKRTTVIAVAGFSACTLLIALLPGYASWGYGAIAVLTLLRLVDGIFMGGEYTSANPLALEASPKHLRGLVGGIIGAAYPVGYLAISVTVTIVLALVPAGSLSSPYVQWGWRIPFVVGALLGVIFLAYFLRVEDSEAWKRTAQVAKPKAPLKDLFRGANFRNLAQVFLLMSGLWLGVQAAISALPGLLENYLGQPPKAVTNGLIVANAILIVAYLSYGLLSQRFGRRRMLILGGIIMGVVSTTFYGLMIGNIRAGGAFALTTLCITIVLCLTLGQWGIVTTYINERFPTSVRASGYGIGYSLAVVIPSFYSFYMLGLAKLMPYEFTPLVLVGLGGILSTLGAALGPETRDVEMASIRSID